MSSIGGAGGARVSIPNHARETIQYIKEIASNHSDEEIYSMLRECSMDPNETVQKLLYQDTFHEVKRKRDRRKENLSNREQSDSTWRVGVQGRGGRGGRGNYSSRYTSNDAGGSKDLSFVKEGGGPHSFEKGSRSNVVQDTENKSSLPNSKSMSVDTNGLIQVDSTVLTDGPVSVIETSSSYVGEDAYPIEESKVESSMISSNNVESSHFGGAMRGSSVSTLHQASTSTLESRVHASTFDAIHLPSSESHHQCDVSTIKREIGDQRSKESFSDRVGSHVIVGPNLLPSSIEKVTSNLDNVNPTDISGSCLDKSQINNLTSMHEASDTEISLNVGSSDNTPSTYDNRPMQLVGSQKVGVNKEWKPKQTKSNVTHPIGRDFSPDVSPTATDLTKSLPVTNTASADTTASKLQNKLEDLNLSDSQHVIFPNHIRIPEAERAGLSFGSFSANFALKSNLKNDSASEKNSTPTQTPEDLETIDDIQDISSGPQNASTTVHDDETPDHPESPRPIHETLSSETDLSGSITAQEFGQSKPDAAPTSSAPQYPLVQSPPAYSSFGLMAPVLGSQMPGFESSDMQTRETSRIPGIVVPQQFDQSTNYYTQMYRAAAESDGRLSPFLVPSIAKYNGNPAILPNQSVQPPQESGNSPVQSTSGPAPIGSQVSGVTQTSIALAQQPVPIFRQPPGVHLSHYPPNYIPYSQYFPSFYIPPPALHPFLSNTAFPQQHPAGGIYPPPVPGGTASVKYSVSQFKSPVNSGNSINTGLAAGYGLYSSTSMGYSPSTATSTVNSTSNDDLTGTPYKENSVYLTGQQSEGSAVWIPAAGRDLPGLQANSFYGISPQGQHVAFTPSQTGHGNFPAVYHANQTMANPAVHPLLQQSQTVAGGVEMVGPPSGVYQQPQRAQNWANNY